MITGPSTGLEITCRGVGAGICDRYLMADVISVGLAMTARGPAFVHAIRGVLVAVLETPLSARQD